MKLVKNAAGRLVPTEVNGKEVIPFKGVNKFKPTGGVIIPISMFTTIMIPK